MFVYSFEFVVFCRVGYCLGQWWFVSDYQYVCCCWWNDLFVDYLDFVVDDSVNFYFCSGFDDDWFYLYYYCVFFVVLCVWYVNFFF